MDAAQAWRALLDAVEARRRTRAACSHLPRADRQEMDALAADVVSQARAHFCAVLERWSWVR